MPYLKVIIPTLFLAALGQSIPQATSPTVPQHKPNFEAEEKRADELFTAKKLVESLPLYEDLCRQDPTIALFAERHGAALLAEEQSIAGISDAKQGFGLHIQGISELKRARSLGDNSEYIRITLALEPEPSLAPSSPALRSPSATPITAAPRPNPPSSPPRRPSRQATGPPPPSFTSRPPPRIQPWYDAAALRRRRLLPHGQ